MSLNESIEGEKSKEGTIGGHARGSVSSSPSWD